MSKAFENMLKLERRVQTKTIDFYQDLFRINKRNNGAFPASGTSLPATGTPQSASLLTSDTPQTALTPPPVEQTPIILSPVDVDGFYKVTGPQEVTFYATTNVLASTQVSAGWTAVGITGILGQIQVTGYSYVNGVLD